MASKLTFTLASLLLGAFACSDHDFHSSSSDLLKRADAEAPDWTYEASYNWGMINTSEFTKSRLDEEFV
jgi:hypothetical protein